MTYGYALTRRIRPSALLVLSLVLASCAFGEHGRQPLSRQAVLHSDDFTSGLRQWKVEAEEGAQVQAIDGEMRIVSPGGLTIWFRPKLEAPVEISYTVTAIDQGGSHDRVSDLNQFWMAREPDGGELMSNSRMRTGVFSDYDDLELYYVGVGGHNNSRTRFRRYIGRQGDRPLLPEHDLTDSKYLIEANRSYRVRILSEGRRQRFYRDGQLIYDVSDSDPYLAGHFGLRTVRNHMLIKDFVVRRVRPDQ